MRSKRIVLVGAGSAQFGVGTVADILMSKVLGGGTIVLHDINLKSLGTVVVGLIAGFLGYTTPAAQISELPNAVRIADMTALAQGMFIVALISWILCLLFYTFVYRTYPSDAEKIRRILEQRRKELEEMKQVFTKITSPLFS
jgi:hypothetical protein